MKPETIAMLRACLSLIEQARFSEHGGFEVYTDFDRIASEIEKMINIAEANGGAGR